ncbi:MAG: hypothetical protein LQ352_006293 [Teloschistes flavicans]|nr:MAG: hypothetical protein LQ352_006293 [Teloschistes flavicans]
MSEHGPVTKTFEQWLAAQNDVRSCLPSIDNRPSSSGGEAIWSVPIISYGNDQFGWEQKEDGTCLTLQYDESTNTFRVITGEGRASMFGQEEQGLKLVAAVTPLLDDSNPLIRLIFLDREAKTDFRNVKLPSAADAEKLVEYLVQMQLITRGAASAEDMAKEWEKAVPDSTGTQQ